MHQAAVPSCSDTSWRGVLTWEASTDSTGYFVTWTWDSGILVVAIQTCTYIVSYSFLCIYTYNDLYVLYIVIYNNLNDLAGYPQITIHQPWWTGCSTGVAPASRFGRQANLCLESVEPTGRSSSMVCQWEKETSVISDKQWQTVTSAKTSQTET
jgi:hypothetical protein